MMPENDLYDFNLEEDSSGKPNKPKLKQIIEALNVISTYEEDDWIRYYRKKTKKKTTKGKAIRGIQTKNVDPKDVYVRCIKGKSKLFNRLTKKPLKRSEHGNILKQSEKIRNTLDKCLKKLKSEAQSFSMASIGLKIENMSANDLDKCLAYSESQTVRYVEKQMQKSGENRHSEKKHVSKVLMKYYKQCLVSSFCDKNDCKKIKIDVQAKLKENKKKKLLAAKKKRDIADKKKKAAEVTRKNKQNIRDAKQKAKDKKMEKMCKQFAKDLKARNSKK
jgi:hypothetical protein